jgi:flavin-dependent dehydrogenase
MVVGADGRNSVVARRLRLDRPHPRLRRMALEAYYWGPSPLRDHGMIALAGGDYAILNPVGTDLVNASIVLDQSSVLPWRGRLEDLFDDRLARLAHAAAALGGMRRQGGVRCLGPLAYAARRTVQAGAILIGDAAGFYDPFTGEGVSHALGDAERAARCIVRALARPHEAAPLLEVFARDQRKARAARQRLGAALQAILRRPALANALAHLLRRRPPAADLLLGVIGELRPLRALWSRDAARALRRPSPLQFTAPFREGSGAIGGHGAG